MVESSKILTVSYGTFSCTLEGFDDSFGTMKAIAEYFRDLAGRDRYFGAEPPTPDAEMLTRIAEREIDRRVDARMDDTGIVLRASDANDTANTALRAAAAASVMGQAAQTPAMPPQPTPPGTFVPSPDSGSGISSDSDAGRSTAFDGRRSSDFDAGTSSRFDAQNSPSQANAPASSFSSYESEFDDESGPTFDDMSATLEETPTDGDLDSVAAKLQRIRAVVGTGNQKDATSERTDANAAFLSTTYVAETEFEDLDKQAELDAAAALAEEEANAAAQAAIEAEAQAEEAAKAAEEAEAEAAKVEAEAAAKAEAEAEAAKVEAEAAAKAEAEAEAAKAEAEAAAKAEAEAEAAKVEAEAAAKAEAEAEAAKVEAEAAARAEAEAETAKVEAEAAPKAEADTAENTEADGSDAQIEAASAAQPAEKPSIRARILRVARPLRPTPVEVDQKDEVEEELDVAPTAADEAPIENVDEVDSLISRVRGARPSAKKTLEVTLQDGSSDVADRGMVASLLNSAAQKPAAEEDAATSVDNTLSDGLEFSDEDANPTEGPMLLTDVIDDDTLDAEVSGTLSDEDEADLQEELAEVEREIEEVKTANRAGRDILPENDDAAMSRILNQTDEELAQPENSRRRNAIAQLKAAVAATEAARQLGDNRNAAAETEDAFRGDLNEVVRPRRASALPKAEARTERPRPAPLKLVAAQRIDAPDDAPHEPVQPRRVASTAASDRSAGNFAEFAAEMGATELEDLLEAAAAYTAFVEGSEDFSRPQIMQKVQATSDTGYSREDSLRSFGTLLREGRINKVRNGRFQISDESRFNPERKAG